MADKRLSFRFFDVVVVLFVATLLISNIGSTKIVGFGSVIFDGGTILFPVAYILGDVLTEVYGFRYARRVIWAGFAALVLMSLTLAIIQFLPAAPGLEDQADAYARIAGFVPRIVGASMIAYLAGSFTNALVLAKLKVKTKGKYFWFRSLASSVVGELIDTLIFSVVAFGGTMPNGDLLKLIATVYLLKITVEAAILPITERIVRLLKTKENVDIFDKPEVLKIIG